MTPTPAPTEERTIYDVQRDLDLDDLLKDAVPPPACQWQEEYRGPECGAPAHWLLVLSCGHSFYYDDPHGKSMHHALHNIAAAACITDDRAPHHPIPMPTRVVSWNPVL